MLNAIGGFLFFLGDKHKGDKHKGVNAKILRQMENK